jgi:hypothetical protein
LSKVVLLPHGSYFSAASFRLHAWFRSKVLCIRNPHVKLNDNTLPIFTPSLSDKLPDYRVYEHLNPTTMSHTLTFSQLVGTFTVDKELLGAQDPYVIFEAGGNKCQTKVRTHGHELGMYYSIQHSALGISRL